MRRHIGSNTNGGNLLMLGYASAFNNIALCELGIGAHTMLIVALSIDLFQ